MFGNKNTRPTEAQVMQLFEHGRQLRSQDDFDGSIEIFNELLQLIPSWVPLYEERARSILAKVEYIESRETNNDFEYMRNLLKQAEDDMTTAIKRAEANKEDYLDIISELYYCRGYIFFRLGTSHSLFLSIIKKGLKNGPDSFNPNFAKDKDRNTLNFAIHDLNKAANYDINNATAHRLKGKIYWEYFDDPDTATREYSKAIDIRATSIDYYLRAWCHYCTGKIGYARADYETALKLDSDLRGRVPFDTEYSYEMNARKWEDFLTQVQR
jgi:tetratricopeptide (TPR) repeat protein